MSDGMGREFTYLSSHATNRYFIPNWGIVLSTLTDLRLPIPSRGEQSFIANLMQSLERKLSNQIAQYDSYNYLKQYLLRQMFI